MSLANVALTNTFDEWRTRTNQIIASLDQNDTITALAFDKANSANIVASSAFDKANSANIVASSAFLKANNALANTTDITFSGNLKYTGNVNVFAIMTHANGTIGAANTVLFSNGLKNYWFPMLKIYDVNGTQIYP